MTKARLLRLIIAWLTNSIVSDRLVRAIPGRDRWCELHKKTLILICKLATVTRLFLRTEELYLGCLSYHYYDEYL